MKDQTMKKMKMHTPDLTQDNIARIRELFPSCVTETKDAQGVITLAVDFDQLKQELSCQIVEGPQERYHLNWPGKRESLLTANAPIAKTLRPARDESVNFDTTKNLFIEGDNLDALKLLQETYLGKVKMIYIDPPYNTGSDFIYNDDFATDTDSYLKNSTQTDDQGTRLVANLESNGRKHSDWLSMMYGRLKLARNLLKDDGVIFISIDDNEMHNLRKICDEIYGEKNFICTLIWNKQHSQQQGLFKKYHEYICLYAKNLSEHSNISGGDGIIEAGALKKISKANPESEFTFPAGVRFDAADGTVLSGTFGDSEKVTVISGHFIAKDGKTVEEITLSAGWTQKDQMKSYFSGQEVLDTKGQKVIEFYFNSSGKLKCRKERSKITPPTILPKYGMVSEQTAYLSSLMGAPVFDNPKPVEMLSDFISWFINPGEIVMDFFAGSATTCEALIRTCPDAQFIAIQYPEKINPDSESGKAASALGYKTISEISKDRIRKAIAAIKNENSESINTGFRVLKIDSSNMADIYYVPDAVKQSDLLKSVENIKPDRANAEDLLFQVLLDWGVDLTLPIAREKVAGKQVYFVDGNALAACFETGISEEFVKELAARQPLRVVFRDNGFATDAVKINVGQIFKQISPATEVKSI